MYFVHLPCEVLRSPRKECCPIPGNLSPCDWHMQGLCCCLAWIPDSIYYRKQNPNKSCYMVICSKGFQTFKTCFLWWSYNSCCTIWTAAKHYAGFWLNVVVFTAVTHLLYIDHNLLQTGSCREETQEHVWTDGFTLSNASWAHIITSLCLIMTKLFVWQDGQLDVTK